MLMTGGAGRRRPLPGELRDGSAREWGPRATRADEGMVWFGKVPGLVSVARNVRNLGVLGIVGVWIFADPVDGAIRREHPGIGLSR